MSKNHSNYSIGWREGQNGVLHPSLNHRFSTQSKTGKSKLGFIEWGINNVFWFTIGLVIGIGVAVC